MRQKKDFNMYLFLALISIVSQQVLASDPLPLAQPQIISLGQPNYTGRYKVEWTSCAGATIYELWESTDPQFQANIRYFWPRANYEWMNRNTTGTWYYKVRAWTKAPEQGGVSSAFSETASQTVQLVNLTVSSRWENSPYGNYLIIWKDLKNIGINIYEIQEAITPDFSGSIMTFWPSANYQWFSHLKNGQYYYRVRGWTSVPEQNGISTSWSQTILQQIGPDPGFTLGNNDQSDAEFAQNNYKLVFDLNQDSVKDFPKEINLYNYPSQYLHMTLSQHQADTGMRFYFDPAWHSGNGFLHLQIETWSGADWIPAGNAILANSQTPGTIYISPCFLKAGLNEMRLQAVSGTEGTNVVTWDQIMIDEIPQSEIVNLGNNDGSDAEFYPGGPVPIFYVDNQSAGEFPKELNLRNIPSVEIDYTLSAEQIRRSITVSLDITWHNGNGDLQIQVDQWNGNYWQTLKLLNLNQHKPAAFKIEPTALFAGINKLKYTALSGTQGTDVVTWDKIKFYQILGQETQIVNELRRYLDVTLNYFLDAKAIHAAGLPLTAVKAGDRARFGYSKPAEWGYALEGWIMAAEIGKVSKAEVQQRLHTALTTMQTIQNDPNSSDQGLFYSFYKITDSQGQDLPFPYPDPKNKLVSSDDIALLWCSLNIAQGWLIKENDSQTAALAAAIKSKLDMRRFVRRVGNQLQTIMYFENGQPSHLWWDVYANEGGKIAFALYASGSISLEEYELSICSQYRNPGEWNGIRVAECDWSNTMFTWLQRTLTGFPMFGAFLGNRNYDKYGTESFLPNMRAHWEYGKDIGVDYPGFSYPMTQTDHGKLISNFYIPPNISNYQTRSFNHITPHGLFVPFAALGYLDADLTKNWFNTIRDLEKDSNGYWNWFGDYAFGFEAIAAPYRNQPNYPGADDGRYVFEILSQTYVSAAIFEGLQKISGQESFYDFAAYVPGYTEKCRQCLEISYHRIVPTPPTISPTQMNHDGHYKIEWSPCGDNVVYELIGSQNPLFSVSEFNQVFLVTDNFVQMEQKLSGTFFYKVRAWTTPPDQGGKAHGFSNRVKQNIDLPPVSQLDILEPRYALAVDETLVTTFTAFALSAQDVPSLEGDDILDGVAAIQYAVKSPTEIPLETDWQNYNQAVNIDKTDGQYYFWYRSIDVAGNSENAQHAVIRVKSKNPLAGLTIPSSSNTAVCQVMNGKVNIYGTAQDEYFACYDLRIYPSASMAAGEGALLFTGNTPVVNSLLAEWDTQQWNSDEYSLILTVNDVLGQSTVAQAPVRLHEPALKQVIIPSAQKGDKETACTSNHFKPQYLVEDTAGNIYITDLHKGAYKLDPSGTQVLGCFPQDHQPEPAQHRLIHPQGIAVDSQGFVYIADQARHCVNKYSNSGEFIKTWPKAGARHALLLQQPQGMCLGPEGLLYLADKLNRRMVVLDKDLNYIKEIRFTGPVTAACHYPGNQLWPTDVAVFGNILYVTDEYASRVYKFRLSDHVCLGSIGKEGSQPEEFKQPQGISINSLGYWYVSDAGNSRIAKYNSKDEVVAVWPIQEIQHGHYINSLGKGIYALANGEVLAADEKLGNVKRYGLGDSLAPLPGIITATIISPNSGSLVNGNVYIVGTAKTADYEQFDGFELSYQYHPSSSPLAKEQCRGIISQGKGPKSLELLGVWDTRKLEPGLYVLTLNVTNQAGQHQQATNEITVGDWKFAGQIGTSGLKEGNNQFNHPYDVETDAHGYLYISDSQNNRIQKYDGQDQYLATLGKSGSRPGEFHCPTNMAIVNMVGNGQDHSLLYVVDSGNQRIQVLDLDGNYIREITQNIKGKAGLPRWQPVSVAADCKARIYILDSTGKVYYLDDEDNLHQVEEWPAGVQAACHEEPKCAFTDLAIGEMEMEQDVIKQFIDRVHQLGQKVEKLSERGKKLYSYRGAAASWQPQNIQIGPLGNVWITDLSHHRVQEFGPYGNLLGSFGGYGSAKGKFDQPHGIVFSERREAKGERRKSRGDFIAYVVDTGNQRVQKFSYDVITQPTLQPTAIPTTNLEIVGLQAEPNMFRPEMGEKTVISYAVVGAINESPLQVHIMILDQLGSMKRDLGEQEIGGAGELHYCTWDGLDNFGRMVMPNTYFIRVQAQDELNRIAVATVPVTVLTKGQELPTPIPTDTSVPTPEKTQTAIPTATPESLPTFKPTEEPTLKPTHTLEPTDTYTPEPTPTPEPTKTYTPEPTNTPPPEPTATPEPELEISHYYAVPNPFRPQEEQHAEIHYTLSINARTQVEIKNQQGQVVYRIGPFVPGEPGARQGENIVIWNGDEEIEEMQGACHWRKYNYLCIISAQAGSQQDQKQFIIVKEIYK